jgi:hypothetical protein
MDRPLLIGGDMPQGELRLEHFDQPETDFAWSMGRFAEAHFAAVPPDGPSLLLIELDVFRAPPMLPGQHALIYLNGLRAHSAFITGRTILRVALRHGQLLDTGNVLTFDLPDAIRPMEFGMEDGRMLGVKLFSIMLDSEG